MLACVEHADVAGDGAREIGATGFFNLEGLCFCGRGEHHQITVVIVERLTRVRALVLADRVGRALEQHFAARVPAFGAEIDEPVARCDHIEIVLNDDQRMSRIEQLVERAQELRYVFEVQTGRRFVEHEQLAARTF